MYYHRQVEYAILQYIHTYAILQTDTTILHRQTYYPKQVHKTTYTLALSQTGTQYHTDKRIKTDRYTKPHTYVLPQTDRYPLSHGDMHHPLHYHNIRRVYAFKDVQTGEEDRGEGKGWLK